MEPSPLDATRTAGDHPTVGCAIQQVLRRAFRAGRRATGLVATAYLVHAVPAAVAAAPPASTEESGLAEVVVTAERVRSTVLETPISLTALSGDALTAAGMTT